MNICDTDRQLLESRKKVGKQHIKNRQASDDRQTTGRLQIDT